MPNPSKHSPRMQVVIDYVIITITCVATALIIQLFQLPNHFVFGGVTGISVLLDTLTPIGFSTWNIVINFVLIIAGFFFLGRTFGIRTVYVSAFTAVCYKVLDKIFPVGKPLTDQPFLETLLVTFTIAALAAVLFDRGACSGGTDILAMILKKKIQINIGHALLIVDIISVLFSFFLYDLTIGLLSLVGLFAKAFVVDTVLESINLCKYFTIVCDDPAPLLHYIQHTVNRGATVFKAEGAYSGQPRSVVLTAVSRAQARDLRNFIHENMPTAFFVISNSSEIVGRGFLSE